MENMVIAILSLLVGLIGVTPLLAYLSYWKFYSPEPFIRLFNEQLGEPIPVPEKSSGIPFFGVSTKSDRKCLLSQVWLSWDPYEVDFLKPEGAEIYLTVDSEFPAALLFPQNKIVVKKFFQGQWLGYEAKKPDFSIKFTICSTIKPTELPFLLAMFPARNRKTERIVRFTVRD